MNCSQVQEYFDEYYSNELNSETKGLIQQHLESCAECKSEYSSLVILKQRAASLKKEVLPPKQIFENLEKEISEKHMQIKNDIKITPLSNNILTIDFQEERKESPVSKPASFIAKNWYWLASAAVILLIISVAVMSYSSKNSYSVEDMSNWKLISLKGGAFINGVKSDKVNIGDWIQTDSESSVILKIANVGDVSIEPNTKVRFIQCGDVSSIEVVYGTVNTSTSQADKFILQSSNMKVQDKGGSYSFKVDDKGNGVIFVNNGIANIESGNKSAVVSDGTFCYYMPEHGVGIPFRKDSKPEFQNALYNYEFNNGGTPAIYYAMANAGPQDYASLVNLIPRVDNQTRYLVLNKLGKLAPQMMPTINFDSLDYYDDEKVENSINNYHHKVKIQMHFDKEELARDMEELAKDLAQMRIDIKIDGKKMAEDIRKEMISLKKELADTNKMKMYYYEEWNAEDREQFNKDMQKMRIELNENLGKMNMEFMKNAEDWKKFGAEWEKNGKEWEKFGKEWEKSSKDWEKFGEEWEKWGEELGKKFTPQNFNFNFNFDSLNIDIKGLEELEKLNGIEGLEGLREMKIDTLKNGYKYYYRYDKDKNKNNKRDKDDEPDVDEKDDAEEI